MKKNVMPVQYKYKTSEYYLAAYLIAKNFGVPDIESDQYEPKKKIFAFNYTDKLEEEVNKFTAGTGLVSALKFKHALTDLKSMIYR